MTDIISRLVTSTVALDFRIALIQRTGLAFYNHNLFIDKMRRILFVSLSISSSLSNNLLSRISMV